MKLIVNNTFTSGRTETFSLGPAVRLKKDPRDAPFHDHEWAVEVVGCELVMLQSTFSHQGHCGNAAKVLAVAKVDLKQPQHLLNQQWSF